MPTLCKSFLHDDLIKNLVAHTPIPTQIKERKDYNNLRTGGKVWKIEGSSQTLSQVPWKAELSQYDRPSIK